MIDDSSDEYKAWENGHDDECIEAQKVGRWLTWLGVKVGMSHVAMHACITGKQGTPAASWAWKAQVRSAHDASGNLISLGTISVTSWKTKCSDMLDYSHRTSNCTTTHYTHGDDRWYSCQISCRWDSSNLTTSLLTWDPFVETLWIFPGLSRFLLFTVDLFAMPLYGIDGSENNQTID